MCLYLNSEHDCLNNDGGYRCECRSGFMLSKDLKHCDGKYNRQRLYAFILTIIRLIFSLVLTWSRVASFQRTKNILSALRLSVLIELYAKRSVQCLVFESESKLTLLVTETFGLYFYWNQGSCDPSTRLLGV